MKLGVPLLPGGEPNQRLALHLPPSARAIQPPQSGSLPDGIASCDRLPLGDLTDDLEVHEGRVRG
jgi:hypothetical protein